MVRLFFSLFLLVGAIDARSLCELKEEDGLQCDCRDTQAFCEATRPLESLVPAVHRSPVESAKRRREARQINTLTLQSPMNESFLQRFPKDIFDEPLQFKTVHIAHAKIATLKPYDVYGSEYLKELTMSFCGIKNFQRKAIAGLANLLKLDLSNNDAQVFKSGVLTGLPLLEELHIAHSSIADIEAHAFLELPSLKTLSLKDNALRFVDNMFFTGLKQLEKLDLSFNYLTNMDDKTFVDLPNLKQVDLSGNNLMIIKPETFKGMSALERLSLNYNDIHSLPDGFLADSKRLSHLDLSRNHLKTVSLETFSGLRAIRSTFELDVRMNPINCTCDLYFLKELHKRRLAVMTEGSRPSEFENLQCQIIVDDSIETKLIEASVFTNDECKEHPELAHHSSPVSEQLHHKKDENEQPSFSLYTVGPLLAVLALCMIASWSLYRIGSSKAKRPSNHRQQQQQPIEEEKRIEIEPMMHDNDVQKPIHTF